MSLTKKEAVELFEIRCRGALAAAFDHAEKSPTSEQWQMLRGTREITLRDMGEISFATVTAFNLSFHERKAEPEAT